MQSRACGGTAASCASIGRTRSAGTASRFPKSMKKRLKRGATGSRESTASTRARYQQSSALKRPRHRAPTAKFGYNHIVCCNSGKRHR